MREFVRKSLTNFVNDALQRCSQALARLVEASTLCQRQPQRNPLTQFEVLLPGSIAIDTPFTQ
jgi:hypothetical protein